MADVTPKRKLCWQMGDGLQEVASEANFGRGGLQGLHQAGERRSRPRRRLGDTENTRLAGEGTGEGGPRSEGPGRRTAEQSNPYQGLTQGAAWLGRSSRKFCGPLVGDRAEAVRAEAGERRWRQGVEARSRDPPGRVRGKDGGETQGLSRLLRPRRVSQWVQRPGPGAAQRGALAFDTE